MMVGSDFNRARTNQNGRFKKTNQIARQEIEGDWDLVRSVGRLDDADRVWIISNTGVNRRSQAPDRNGLYGRISWSLGVCAVGQAKKLGIQVE